MYHCMICKGNAENLRSFITVRTLHIRGFGGVKRVQGIGKKVEGSVCENCIREEIDKALHPFGKDKQNIKRMALYGLLFAAGILLAVFVPGNVIRLFGSAAALCGILCIYSDLQKIAERKRTTTSGSEEQNIEKYSLELIINNLPKKNGDEDLTYVPLDKSLTHTSLGDLCIKYNLLPEIAKEVRDIAIQYFSSGLSGTE